MKIKKIILVFIIILTLPKVFGQSKNYNIESSIIDVSSIFDISCFIEAIEGNCLKKINISYSGEDRNVRIKDFSIQELEVLNDSNFYLQDSHKNFVLTGSNLFYRCINEKTVYHSNIEILLFKVGEIIIIGYSIDNLPVVDSLKCILQDYFRGEHKDLVLNFLDKTVG